MNGPVFLAVGLLYIAPALYISNLNDQTTCQLLGNFMSKNFVVRYPCQKPKVWRCMQKTYILIMSMSTSSTHLTASLIPAAELTLPFQTDHV